MVLNRRLGAYGLMSLAGARFVAVPWTISTLRDSTE